MLSSICIVSVPVYEVFAVYNVPLSLLHSIRDINRVFIHVHDSLGPLRPSRLQHIKAIVRE